MKNHKGADCAYPGVEFFARLRPRHTTYGHWTAGPGASRYVAGHRETNHKSTTTYIHRILSNQSPIAESEQLGPEDSARERLFFSLRRLEGLNPTAFAASTGFTIDDLLGSALQPLLDRGLFTRTPTNLRLTRPGLLLSDSIWPHFLCT